MGTRVPPIEPIGPGELCSNCWGLGGLFGLGPTPDGVIVLFEGVEKDVGWLPGDGEPPDGVFTWVQDKNSPCQFDDGLIVSLAGVAFSNDNTLVGASSSTGVLAFSGNPLLPCQLIVENGLNGKFHLGTATFLL